MLQVGSFHLAAKCGEHLGFGIEVHPFAAFQQVSEMNLRSARVMAVLHRVDFAIGRSSYSRTEFTPVHGIRQNSAEADKYQNK
jgi:aminoglycoside phosphotransferase (APT) family kinase protein